MKSHIVHHCELKNISQNGLPKLPPKSGYFRKLLRKIQLELIVSPENYDTRFFFRSTAAIRAEIQRHRRLSKSYIIHPFSKFRIKFEMIMSILWFIQFAKNPLITAFFETTIDEDTGQLSTFHIILHLCTVFNIIVCFLTGTPKFQTKEVILQPRSIAKHYLLTFFLCDIISAIPFYYIAAKVEKLNFFQHRTILFLVTIIEMISFARLSTALRYFRRITSKFGLTHTSWKITDLVIKSLFLVHWAACYIYTISKILLDISRTTKANSWLGMAKIEPFREKVTTWERYVQCLLIGICHFFGAGYGQYEIINQGEIILFSFIMVCGHFYKTYIAAVVLQLFMTTTASTIKYREVLNQLDTYCSKNKLSPSIRRRLTLFYEHRFNKHYFKEEAILNTLSQHLKYEIYLHSCKALLEKVALFRSLSRSTVGVIMGYLKREVFLPNEVIMKQQLGADSIYFIAFGTVAIILDSELEYKHLQDGDHFGLVPMFAKKEPKLSIVVSLECTEVFKLHQKDLERCIVFDEEVYNVFKKAALERHKELITISENNKANKNTLTSDVLYQLRKGKILEHSHYSRRVRHHTSL
ncbi:hypothetical protein RN001_002200 [Aquatica leii]|uniref:Cyclic nucleotide-binding domain-containing protein n=1 Tax=Aquatica leii TaxID=1421715 RepID=A0AAN7SLQ5_9COLE|nr:hypothetical protein RN001_002200 [Aquatica leii]